MDTVTEFFLSDATITYTGVWMIVIFAIVGILFIFPAIFSAMDKAWGWSSLLGALALTSIGLTVAGIVISVNEPKNLEQSVQNTIFEIEEAYNIEVYSSTLEDTITQLQRGHSKNRDVIQVSEVTYVYDGQGYTTDLTIMYKDGNRGASISLFAEESATPEKISPFDPSSSKASTKPLSELQTSDDS